MLSVINSVKSLRGGSVLVGVGSEPLCKLRIHVLVSVTIFGLSPKNYFSSPRLYLHYMHIVFDWNIKYYWTYSGAKQLFLGHFAPT